MPITELVFVESKMFERSFSLFAIPRIAEKHSADIPEKSLDGRQSDLPFMMDSRGQVAHHDTGGIQKLLLCVLRDFSANSAVKVFCLFCTLQALTCAL